MSSEFGSPPGLPSGWERPRLAEIARINPAFNGRATADEVKVNFVPMRAVEPEGGGLLRPEVRTYSEVRKGYTSFLSGDVIMAKITPCMENGKVTVVPDLPGSVCFGSTEFHVFRPEHGIVPSWIAKFLLQNDFRRAAQRAMTGGVGQMRVPAEFLETVRLPLAPSNEQCRIADALDELFTDLDAGIAALERVRTRLAHYRASVLKAAVEGTLTAEWRQQHPHTEPASDLLKRILAERRRRWEEAQLRKFNEKGQEPPENWKAKYREPAAPDVRNLPPLPVHWCWTTMDQLAWASGYGTSQKCRETETGLAVLRIPNIIRGDLDLANLKYASPEHSADPEDLVGIGDLLVVRTNGSQSLIGRGAVIRAAPALPLGFASYLIRLRLAPMPNLLEWVSFLWQGSHVRHWIENHAATSAGQFNISLGVLTALAVPLPPSEEQEVLAEDLEDQLSVIEHLEDDLSAQIHSAQALRHSILRHAFTGQLVPQDSNDEPASELLKRIAAEREARARESGAAKCALAKTGARRPRKKRTKES